MTLAPVWTKARSASTSMPGNPANMVLIKDIMYLVGGRNDLNAPT
ncbi:MAG TPA: hypothetical protein VJ914_22480 [Pseudonocardiaceae bacterium]|nr:hypothetical protein [Pseudonocardiaceae bacterium]